MMVRVKLKVKKYLNHVFYVLTTASLSLAEALQPEESKELDDPDDLGNDSQGVEELFEDSDDEVCMKLSKLCIHIYDARMCEFFLNNTAICFKMLGFLLITALFVPLE
jgi:hypothetical protein